MPDLGASAPATRMGLRLSRGGSPATLLPRSYRPRDPAVAAKYASQFTNVPKLVNIDTVFGGWSKAQAKHFADHGTFDKIYGQ